MDLLALSTSWRLRFELANYFTRAVHHVGLLYTSHSEDVLKVKVFITREDD